jgi:hypothetical protein
MNRYSVICKFIAQNPTNWEEIMTNDLCIKVKRDKNLAIFNYAIGCNFQNPVVQEARGIIIDLDTLDVVCWPFRKFGNHTEPYADTIDWPSARVLEKIDGSIVKLWFDKGEDKWQFSTNGTIRAEGAPISEYAGVYFLDIIRRTDNFDDIPFDALDKDTTYIFELVSPETEIVIKYPTPLLYHIGTRNNITGAEFEVDIGMPKPKSFALGSLDDCVKASIELNQGDVVDSEGFVVVDKDYHRVKVKSPEYFALHRLKSVETVSKKDAIQMILDASEDIEKICSANASLVPLFKFYEFKIAEVKVQADKIGVLSRSLLREYDGNRGSVARVISKHPLSTYGFLALDKNKSGGELFIESGVDKIAKYIPDYTEPDIYSLFLNDDKK